VTDAIKLICEQIVACCRERWPAADWITLEGPQIDWRNGKALEIEPRWFLYVADRASRSFQLWKESPAAMLDALQSLPAADLQSTKRSY
jgi:hypothetical protein